MKTATQSILVSVFVAGVCVTPTRSSLSAEQATEHPEAKPGSVQTKAVAQSATSPKPLPPEADPYCDSLDSAYPIVKDLATALREFERLRPSQQQPGSAAQKATNRFEHIREASKHYIWLPLAIQKAFLDRFRDEISDQVLARTTKNKREYYDKADSALSVVIRGYVNIPYPLTLFVLHSHEINAQAIGAYVYVDRGAVSQLDEDSLTLILAHEVAHFVKGHTSRQLQLAIVDAGLAEDVDDRIRRGVSGDELTKLIDEVSRRISGNFPASGLRQQELQADACAARGSPTQRSTQQKQDTFEVGTKGVIRPQVGHGGYLRGGTKSVIKGRLEEFPDDETRDAFFAEAVTHHIGSANKAKN
jgi:hypothetical protein